MKGERGRGAHTEGPFIAPGRAPRAAANTNAGGAGPAEPPAALPGRVPAARGWRRSRFRSADAPKSRAAGTPGAARGCGLHLRAGAGVGRGASGLPATPLPARSRGPLLGSGAARPHPGPRCGTLREAQGRLLREARLGRPCAGLLQGFLEVRVKSEPLPGWVCVPPAAPYAVRASPSPQTCWWGEEVTQACHAGSQWESRWRTGSLTVCQPGTNSH